MLNGFKRPRRVVITGFGCVTPLGTGREKFWRALCEGASGVRRIERFDVSDSPVKIAAEVIDFDADEELSVKDRRHVARTVPLALRAAREAIGDAKLAPEDMTIEERRAVGVVLGTGGGGLSFTEEQYGHFYRHEYARASVYTIPASTHGGLSSELSMRWNLRGLSHIVSTGCTSSTDAIAYAAEHIALGRQNVMLTGGVDAPLAPGILAGFNHMTVLTDVWNDEPARASRPFSRDRSGIVLGEGAWIYVLEEYEAAMRRKANVYAEITGYGATCDAYHRVRLEDTGEEPARAMTLALKDAGRAPDEIDYINLHGTSTQLNDRIETQAVKLAFGESARRIPMSGTKSQIGHPQGASGAAGIAAALCAMHTNTLPPTINLDEPDPTCDLDYVPNVAREATVKIALCNCIGFGSKNSALVIEKL
ncbi:MAG: beta-ketoacyl-[acyl-carrier-protein] synthase family protein [Pyrinomonadaceae bacterium MAG19_C2-C3]|nr:beta-ketoacyl-[acyl-carrier-protein] synthase family protein [Pyrinomonadaceae bacterium MAG19_C2-C3]